ncbi:MAG: potassium-transporting ATPase subunit KdpC [Sulfuricaulis sp.]|uniref:potassium-transporting ATPase subunit KdpC n=1 Tax=Sulfuricaulis sp. TaxID=2003553 RepID=UPI003C33026E
MWNHLKSGFTMLVYMTVITGLIYPVVVTAVAQAFLSKPANGSLIVKDGKPIGSALIGQPFSNPKYFWSRPSAIGPYPYNAGTSSGSNQGPTNPALTDAVAARIKALRDADPGNTAPVPADLVTASASGLDPDVSPAAAYFQAQRVARVRNLDIKRVQNLIAQHVQGRQFWVLGEPRVNVLELNLALDQLL